jgi:archaellum component FlaF (FlaF/FlaG flagellin family)
MSQYIYSRIYRKKALIALVSLFVMFAGLYAYFLQNTVMSVVERKALDTEIASLHSQIGDAVYNYSASVSEVTIDKAVALGFSPVDEATYVTRADRATLVSINVTEE